jgi:hypothetical protein
MKLPWVRVVGVIVGLLLAACLAACSDDGESCAPDCSGRVCGLDPLCGESCGTCPEGACLAGACVGCLTDEDCGQGAGCSAEHACVCLLGECGGACCLPAQAELSAAGVLLVSGELVAGITVRVTSADGTPLAGVPLGLITDAGGVTVEPAEAATLADGRFTFSARTQVVGEATFQAVLLEPAGELGEPLAVSFTLSLGVTSGALRYAYPGASAEVRVEVLDAAGPVPSVEVSLSSDRGALDALAPASATTGEDGQVAFQISSQTEGTATLTAQVVGLSGASASGAPLAFAGPSLSGNASNPQPGGQSSALRAGLVWIDRPSLIAGVFEARELTSVPQADLAFQATRAYALQAPLQPPEEDFYRPDPGNPELPESFEVATYAPALYSDQDSSGDLSAPDQLLGFRADRDLLLLYVRGELPDPALAPGLVEGYQFIRWSDEEQSFSPLAEHLQDNDLWLRGADCPSSELQGEVAFRGDTAYALPTYLAVMLLRPAVVDEPGVWWNPGNQRILATQQVALTPGQATPYALDLPWPQDADPDYRDMLVSPGVGLPRIGVLYAFAFVDGDGDGVFTNLDANPLTGDEVIGLPDFPFGYGTPILEWVEDPLSQLQAFSLPGANLGYNLVLGPMDLGIAEVVDDHTLRLLRDVEGNHADLCFRVVRRGGGAETVILTGTDLSTGILVDDLVTSGVGGFSALVLPGDRLILCNAIPRQAIFDLDTHYPLTAR